MPFNPFLAYWQFVGWWMAYYNAHLLALLIEVRAKP